MANTAEQTARNAEADNFNAPGMCLQVCRTWAGIGAKYPDAATAANHAARHAGTGPRGSFAYWVGGSSGHGHIAVNLGGGMIRSTDVPGSGRVSTVPLSWIAEHWGQRYVGWAWDCNDVSVVHDPPKPSRGAHVDAAIASLKKAKGTGERGELIAHALKDLRAIEKL